MLKNYFLIAWRNMLKSKVFSLINVAGLAIGMTISLLIGLWIWDEITFNNYFKNHDRLAQVWILQTMNNETGAGTSNSIPVGGVLRTQFPDKIKHVAYVSWNGDHLVKVNESPVTVSGVWAQADFPKMFTLDMREGNHEAFNDPSTVLISASLAKSLFGNGVALNRVLKIDNYLDLKVGGVYADLPRNTKFYNTQLLLPWDNKENWRNSNTEWDNHMAQLFVELHNPADLNRTNAAIRNVPTPHIKEWKEEIFLHPLNKDHLYDKFENGKQAGGAIQFVWLFGTIGIFVLLLACINFMNLSTARSEKRAREVGIRKAVGSLKKQLVVQFLSESVVFSLLSMTLAVVLVQLSLPFFNELAGKDMSIPFGNPVFWLLIAGFSLFTGLIAGSYPAFYLSSFNPIKVLKGSFRMGRQTSIPRKTLVVLQFTVSVMLIIGTIIVFRQIEYTKERPVGYSRKGLITIPLTGEFDRHYNTARYELMQNGSVENMSKSSYGVTNFDQNNSIDWKGRDPKLVIFFRDVNVTPEFGKTINWEIVKGRDFSRDFPADSGGAVILNEASAKVIGFKNPIGETIKWQNRDHTIIGIVKDMVTQSPYEPVEPAVFFWEGWNSVVSIRIKPSASEKAALEHIQAVFKKYDPEHPFQYSFVEDQYAGKFRNEVRIGNLASVFAILAIFISCLGLFGLASFVAEQRSKEIGIRKVLGATVLNAWRLLTKEFVLLVIISLFIAIPLAYYFMQKWLQDYKYHTNPSWWIFAVAGVGVTLITLITVSFQAIRAAIANPVDSLRTE